MIDSTLEHDILEIRINRPESKNALSHSMYDELAELLRQHGTGETCKAIVFYGAGDCFTAGADLKDFQKKRGPGDSPAVKFLRALSAVQVPLVAAVEGFAIGIGTTLLQHFDFVYATPATRFRLPFIALGLCPEGGSSLLLERLVGRRKATDWLLSCRFFNGQEAFEAGFITELAQPGETLAKARETAASLAKLPKGSIKLTKAMMKKWSEPELQDAFDDEVAMYARCLATEETQAQIQAMRSR